MPQPELLSPGLRSAQLLPLISTKEPTLPAGAACILCRAHWRYGPLKNAVIGGRLQDPSHTYICEVVTIEDEVLVGNGVMS